MKEIVRIEIDEQKKILDEKLDKRVRYKIVNETRSTDQLQKQVIFNDLCSKDWKFFVDNCVFLLDPEAKEKVDKNIPFLLWDYQEKAGDEIVKAIENGYDLPIEKSRNLGLTWLALAIILWGWHYHQWEVLVGSRKFEEVDKRGDPGTLFQKLRYMIELLPEYVLSIPLSHYTDKVGLISHPHHGATIVGEANNVAFGRSDRRKVILMDEFASWDDNDAAAWQACGDTAKCRIPISTPNSRGTNCFFYEVVQAAKQKGLPYLSLHWSLHPKFSVGIYYDELGKARSPWYDKKCSEAVNINQIAQEQDINYDVASSGKVFGEFNEGTQVSDAIEYDENLPLYVSWDFGLDQTALLWFQPDRKKRKIYIIDEYVNDGNGMGDNIYHYLDILDAKGYKKAIHFGDPHSGENRSITSGQSPATILRRSGIIFKSKRARILARVQAGRNLLAQLEVSSKCSLAIEMFRNWSLRRAKSGNQSAGVPDHSIHSHIGEAYTYFCYNYSNPEIKKEKKRKEYRQSIGGVTL